MIHNFTVNFDNICKNAFNTGPIWPKGRRVLWFPFEATSNH